MRYTIVHKFFSYKTIKVILFLEELISTIVPADVDQGLGFDVALDEHGNHITGYCNVTLSETKRQA